PGQLGLPRLIAWIAPDEVVHRIDWYPEEPGIPPDAHRVDPADGSVRIAKLSVDAGPVAGHDQVAAPGSFGQVAQSLTREVGEHPGPLRITLRDRDARRPGGI